jgi:hypothetical protein
VRGIGFPFSISETRFLPTRYRESQTATHENPVRQVLGPCEGDWASHFLTTAVRMVPMQHIDAVRSAADQQDLSALSNAMDGLTSGVGLEEATVLIRSDVLPQLSIKGLLWLWQSITSPVEQYKLLSLMSERTTMRLIKNGFVFGQDFSFAEAHDGNRHLMLSAEAKQYLELTLKADSLVTLQLLTRHKHVA